MSPAKAKLPRSGSTFSKHDLNASLEAAKATDGAPTAITSSLRSMVGLGKVCPQIYDVEGKSGQKREEGAERHREREREREREKDIGTKGPRHIVQTECFRREGHIRY
jgi:hypothetical protein